MLNLPNIVPITVTIGAVNAIQIVRATIECPDEDTVSVVLDVQGLVVDDNGSVSSPIALPRVVLTPAAAADVYASVREAIYNTLKADPSVPVSATLSPLLVKGVKG